MTLILCYITKFNGHRHARYLGGSWACSFQSAVTLCILYSLLCELLFLSVIQIQWWTSHVCCLNVYMIGLPTDIVGKMLPATDFSGVIPSCISQSSTHCSKTVSLQCSSTLRTLTATIQYPGRARPGRVLGNFINHTWPATARPLYRPIRSRFLGPGRTGF